MSDAGKMKDDLLEAWNSHDLGKILSFFTDDCIYEDLAVQKTTPVSSSSTG